MRQLRGGFGAVTCRHVLAARVESHPVDPGSQVDRPGGQEDLAIRSDQDLERDGRSVSATSRETQNEVEDDAAVQLEEPDECLALAVVQIVEECARAQADD